MLIGALPRSDLPVVHLHGVEHRCRGVFLVGTEAGYKVLVSRKGLPDAMQRLVNADRRLRVPPSPLLQPAEVFLDFHRQEIFDRRC